MSVQSISGPAGAQHSEQIIGLLARPPRVEGIALDTSYFDASPGSPTRDGAWRVLLPSGYSWRAQDAAAGDKSGNKVPLQLCEYLAYKTALAYESSARIEQYLMKCCTGTTRFRFFDSAKDKSDTHGIEADAQAFGYVFERTAFIIFRGTSSGNDWKINRIDALTSELGGSTDRRYRKLEAKYGKLLSKLGNPMPPRHVGFSIAWAALKDQVENWLSDALENRAIDQIVYSGHSLGGAMAQIAAFDHARIEAKYEKDRGIKPTMIGAVVTFGAPAVGTPKFAEEYGALLADRTVLLESSGDLVPRIMQRWYYRMLYPLRQRIRAGIQAHLQDKGDFSKVVSPWSFASEPPLSNGDIEAAIQTIRSGGERVLRHAAEKNEQKKKEDDKKRQEQIASMSDGGAQQASGGKPDTADTGALNKDAPAGGTAGPAKTTEAAPSVVYWVVVGVVVIAVAGIAWYFVRRKLFSHDIEQRYALYLSTLSYQQLRAKHGGNVVLANQELEEHLRAMRGNLKDSADIARDYPDEEKKHPPFYESVVSLPLPLEIRQDPEFIEYLKRSETFV